MASSTALIAPTTTTNIDPSNPCNDPSVHELNADGTISDNAPPCGVHLVPSIGNVTTPQVNSISDGLMWLALVAALVTLLVTAVIWTFALQTDNSEAQFNARRGALAAAAAAVFIGATPALIDFWVRIASKG